MNKKLSHLLAILMIMGGMISCDNFLDTVPDNRAQVDTPEKVRKLLISAYPARSFAFILEAASDNMDQNPTSLTNQVLLEAYYFWRNDVEVGNDKPEDLFGAYYLGIANANAALDAIQKLGDSESLSPLKGEALMARAYNHFVLANIYCKHYGATSSTDLGMPYADSPETEVSPQHSRGTVAQLYERIDADIEAALPLIDDDGYDVPKYHFNKKAAYAFAARFNLYYGKYDKVIEYATEVLGSDPEPQLRNWAALGILPGNGNHRTDAYIDVANPATLLVLSTFSLWQRFYRGYRYSHNAGISNNETLHAAGPWGTFNNLQVRPVTFGSGNPAVIINKMEEYWETLDPIAGTGYAHMMHVQFTTDETLLCRAEAYALKKDYAKAMDDMNLFVKTFTKSTPLTIGQINDFYNGVEYYNPIVPTVKKRLNPDFVIDQGNQENMLHFILHARRLLTLHEGLRWSDVKRYGIEIHRRSIDENQNIVLNMTLTKEDPRRALQLPGSIIGAGLEPNPR